jgi:RNA polymerase sigma factor (sigma-70 family)
MASARAVRLGSVAFLVRHLRRPCSPADLRPPRPSGIVSPHNRSHEAAVLPPSSGFPPAGYRKSVSYEQIFLDNLQLIEAVVIQVCRRHIASDDETEEFRSLAHIKLLDGDHRVLRERKGRSSLRVYLTVVLEREFLDYRNGKWGKWRPSVEARRMGDVAMLLERLVCRDRYTFDEAVEIIRTNRHASESRESLWRMFLRFPARVDRRPAPEQTLAYISDPRPLPDEEMQQIERDEERRRAYAALAAAVSRLEPEDRLILKLHYFDGLKQIEIARALHLDAKRLYRRCERLLATLRRELEAQGLDPRALDWD